MRVVVVSGFGKQGYATFVVETSGFRHPKRKNFPGLVKVGHVGIKFPDDPRIFGFHPTPKAIETAGGEDALLNLLLQREPQPGNLQDDTEIFVQAYQLSQEGERSDVWVLDQEYVDERFRDIRDAAMKWYNDENAVAQYNLPKRDGTFEPGEYNCATFPRIFGMELPVDTGSVAKYVDAMKNLGARKWSPQPDNL